MANKVTFEKWCEQVGTVLGLQGRMRCAFETFTAKLATTHMAAEAHADGVTPIQFANRIPSGK